jgi:hypothetical protein
LHVRIDARKTSAIRKNTRVLLCVVASSVTSGRWKHLVPSKRWEPSTKLQDAIAQMITKLIFPTFETSHRFAIP